MLCLQRFVGERICIGDEIVITLIKSKYGKATIGIEAPSSVRVDREEVRRDIESHGRRTQEGEDK